MFAPAYGDGFNRGFSPWAFGAAASFAALLLWLYYTAQIFLFGAEFTACLGGVNRDEKKTLPEGDGSERDATEATSASREVLGTL